MSGKDFFFIKCIVYVYANYEMYGAYWFRKDLKSPKSNNLINIWCTLDSPYNLALWYHYKKKKKSEINVPSRYPRKPSSDFK